MLTRRVRYWLESTKRRRMLREEMELHIDEKAAELRGRGWNESDARREARRRFGSVSIAAEDARAAWIIIWLERLLCDLRYAVRTLSGHRGFSVVVVLTLALGIGMNTAVFSIVNAVLLRPLPYPEPDRLVWLSLSGSEIPLNNAIPMSEFMTWRDQARAFDLMVAYESTQDHLVQTADSGTLARNAWISDDFWQLAGVRPVLGRLPTPGEENVLLLSHAFHERWFRGDSDVVGAAVAVNGPQATVIGVLPEGFDLQFPQESLGPLPDLREIEIFRPYGGGGGGVEPQIRGQGAPVRVVARLRPGLALDDARADLEVVRARLAAENPVPYLDQATLGLTPLREKLVGGARTALVVAVGAVGFVLLIACSNIAHLLLARASARRKEIAVRIALGAGRSSVFRQLLAEGLVLAIPAALAGLLVARWGLESIVRIIPDAVPRLTDAVIDGRVLAFAVAASVLTACLFGLVPAISLWRVSPLDDLRAGMPGASPDSGTVRVRSLLVGLEIALAVVLLTGAGLMVKSFARMTAHPDGFQPDRILAMNVQFTLPYVREPARRAAYADELLSALRSIPGTEAAAVTTAGQNPAIQVRMEGSSRDQETGPAPLLHAVSADYANVMGLRPVTGRWLTDTEPADVAVITESIASSELGEIDPIGRRLEITLPGAGSVFVPVVGVVADQKYSRLDADSDPQVYIPYARNHQRFGRLTALVRTSVDSRVLASEIQGLASAIDPTLPIYDVMTFERALTESIAPRRLNLFLLATFAGTALLLAVIGLYGVIAYSVVQRTHEIGIRMALGAGRGAVIRMVLVRGMTIASVGMVFGIASAFGLTRFMESLVYGVEPDDPATFVVVSFTLALTVLTASLLPAYRAARTDLLLALRHE